MSRTLTVRRALRGHLTLARISNSPTVVSDVLAGAAIGGTLWPDGGVVLVALAMLCFYTAGMYLNDLFDYVIDCSERPERPLPSGLVTRSSAIRVVVVLFCVGSLLLWMKGPILFLSGLLLIICIICYDCWHKNKLCGPLLMGLCRGMIYIIAFLACSAHPFAHSLWLLLIASTLLVLYVTALTALAKSGRRASLARIVVIVTLFFPLLYIITTLSLALLLALLPGLLFAGWIWYSITLVDRRPRRWTELAVGQLIAGIALVDGLVLAVAGSIASMSIALLAFCLTLFLQRYVKGT